MSSVNRCVIRYEDLRSWVGSYQQALPLNFKFLNERCFFCRVDYVPEDRVIIFHCQHGMHETCFSLLDRKICPHDQMSMVEAKVSFLGYSILMPREPFGRLIEARLDRINKLLQERITTMATHQPEDYQRLLREGVNAEAMQALASHLQQFFRTFSEIYNQPDRGNEIFSLVDGFNALFEQHAASFAEIIDFHFDWNVDLKNYSSTIFKMMDLSVGSLKARSFVFFMGCYLRRIMPRLSSSLGVSSDTRFREYHLSGYQKSTAHYQYLSRMDSHSLNRFDRMMNSDEIHRHVQSIEGLRALTQNLPLLAALFVFISLFVASQGVTK